MPQKNPTNQSRRTLDYVTAISVIVAMFLSIGSFMREGKDQRARQETHKAKVGFTEISKNVEELSEDVKVNRQLCMMAWERSQSSNNIISVPRTLRPHSRGEGSSASRPSSKLVRPNVQLMDPSKLRAPKIRKHTPWNKIK